MLQLSIPLIYFCIAFEKILLANVLVIFNYLKDRDYKGGAALTFNNLSVKILPSWIWTSFV